MTIDAELQAQVDAQLLEQGAFAVLDFLMESGRLLADDYGRWRRGEIRALDEVLMGSTEKIRLQVETMADYARKIGLVQQQQVFHPWHSDLQPGPAPLLISTDPRLSGLLASRFVPAQNSPQLDLFFDNPVVALTSGIVRALSAGNRGAAQRQLDRLYAQAPNHADLAAYDRLLAALETDEPRLDDPRRELAHLVQISPVARRLMGSQARDLLAPLWRRLAGALRDRAFRSGEPDLHASFSLGQAEDWAGVARSVCDEPRWWLQAPLCLRLAQSSFHLRDRTRALSAWFHLCWRDPAEAAAALENRRQPDTGVAASWRRFVDEPMDLATGSAGTEVTLGAADFPAWLLLQEPGLTRQLGQALPPGNTPAEENYRHVHCWIEAHRTGRTGEEMMLRKTLQAASPILFELLKRSV